jgi:Uma2 family endonuclease
MSPTGTLTGNFHTHILAAIYNWNAHFGLGEVFDSSTGFTLPNGAVRSPDASWISTERWATVPEQGRDKFATICPDFVVEVRSKSDELSYLLEKMTEYIDNGAQLGWLIDRLNKKVYVFRADGSVENLQTNVVLSGEHVLPGFSLNLAKFIK